MKENDFAILQSLKKSQEEKKISFLIFKEKVFIFIFSPDPKALLLSVSKRYECLFKIVAGEKKEDISKKEKRKN